LFGVIFTLVLILPNTIPPPLLPSNVVLDKDPLLVVTLKLLQVFPVPGYDNVLLASKNKTEPLDTIWLYPKRDLTTL